MFTTTKFLLLITLLISLCWGCQVSPMEPTPVEVSGRTTVYQKTVKVFDEQKTLYQNLDVSTNDPKTLDDFLANDFCLFSLKDELPANADSLKPKVGNLNLGLSIRLYGGNVPAFAQYGLRMKSKSILTIPANGARFGPIPDLLKPTCSNKIRMWSTSTYLALQVSICHRLPSGCAAAANIYEGGVLKVKRLVSPKEVYTYKPANWTNLSVIMVEPESGYPVTAALLFIVNGYYILYA
jgi:hypothetical protein